MTVVAFRVLFPARSNYFDGNHKSSVHNNVFLTKKRKSTRMKCTNEQKKSRVSDVLGIIREKKNPATRFRRVRRFNVDRRRKQTDSVLSTVLSNVSARDTRQRKNNNLKKRFFAPVYSVIGANTRGARVM